MLATTYANRTKNKGMKYSISRFIFNLPKKYTVQYSQSLLSNLWVDLWYEISYLGWWLSKHSSESALHWSHASYRQPFPTQATKPTLVPVLPLASSAHPCDILYYNKQRWHQHYRIMSWSGTEPQPDDKLQHHKTVIKTALKEKLWTALET